MKENMDLAGTVYILGGIRAISTAVEEKITIGGFKNIKRLGGSDRYETSLKIAEQLDTKIGTPVVLVSGESYPDALSISSEAALMQYPILLTQKNGISDAIKSKIAEFKPIKVYIIGLQGAVSTAVEEQAVQITGLAKENIVRIGGSDRYETSLAVAKYFGISEQKVCIATGKNYPDALAGSVYAANNDAPIILVDEKLSDNITNYLKTRKVSEATIFGGESVVSKDLEDNLLRLLTK
jgi:putative cell wall-binding protein